MAPRAGAIAVKTAILDFDEADVSVDITARAISETPDNVLVGDSILYTALIHNAGPQPSQRVRLHIELPTGASFGEQTFGGPTVINGTSCSHPQRGEQGGSVDCTIPALPAGVTTGIVVLVQTLVAGEISSTVSISGADTPDPDLTNNSLSVQCHHGWRCGESRPRPQPTPDSVFVDSICTAP
jgi:uncharacterized repeat protein (TIGR01451 family)